MESNLTRNERLIEDGHDYSYDAARANLERIHCIYRDTLNAMVASAARNHIMLSVGDLEIAMEGVGEALANEADRPLEYVPNESYTPANAKALIAKAHGTLVEALRVKPIDWSGTFEAIFRPQTTRGLAPTNPATLLTKGAI